MQYNFLNTLLEKKDLLTQTKVDINPFLLENNEVQIEKLYSFFQSNINLLYVNGFSGTGKAAIVNYSTSFLSDDVIVLKYNCFNSTVLDDVLLALFRDFKSLSAQNIISEPKIKTENFAQKVNSYFSQIEKPFLIILDSFEAILDENRQELVDFIFHLNSMSKIKVIIIGRTFSSKLFNELPVERITTLAFEQSIFDKYLKFEKIKAQSAIIEEFYKHTRGYYLFTTLSVALIKHQNTTLVDFLINLKDSFLAFNKFLAKQALTLVPESEKNLFWFLSIIRHPISIELLQKLDFYNEENFHLLIENSIVLKDGTNIYVQDYLKDAIEEAVSPAILHRIRRYIIDLYQTQLPLKPLDRDIPISRQTMRKEIDYHKLFLPKKYTNPDNSPVDINYLSYSKVFSLGEKEKHDEEKMPEAKDTASGIDLTQRKNISINLDNLPIEGNEKKHSFAEVEHQHVLEFKEIIEFIKKAEQNYEYSDVIAFCKGALAMETDSMYESSLPFLYSKIAHAYHKIAQSDNAIEYYKLLGDIFETRGDFAKASNAKFKIASIFYESYKMDKAKSLFIEIVENPQSPKLLVVKSYLKLSSIEEDSTNLQNSLQYYNSAFKYVSVISDDEVLAELYFKYALIMDDKNDTKTAIEYYHKCIDLNNNPTFNKFLSPAYSNLATLYFENKDNEKAIVNYTKAYELDKQSSNFEGMYDSSSKLASIFQYKQPQKAIEYLNIALDNAKKMNDAFYIISSALALGDYYCDSKKDELGLKYYINALDLAKNNLSQENIYKINVRINDVKFRLGEVKFNSLLEIIYEQESE